jgi:mRNA-degrading endonuclease RelE of RelBE toxin-antitoxin system
VADYTLEFDERAVKDLEGISPKIAQHIVEKLLELEVSVRPRGDTIKSLKGFTVPTLRYRVGDYRAVFRVAEDRVVVLRVVHRSQLDRTLQKLR